MSCTKRAARLPQAERAPGGPNERVRYPVFVRTTTDKVRIGLRVVVVTFGWTLFFFWWHSVSADTRWTLILSDFGVVAVVGLLIWATAIGWVRHNLRLAENDRRRRAPASDSSAPTHDWLGREIELRDGAGNGSHRISIEVVGNRKIYRPGQAKDGRVRRPVRRIDLPDHDGKELTWTP